MAFPKNGIAKETLFETLNDMKANDLPWKSGKVLAYTYDPGPETYSIVQEAYLSFLTENALDPTSFPSAQKLEVDVVHILRELLRGDDNVVGNCTFGGTESIMCAVKTARDWARANRPEIDVPEMVLSKTAHAAFHKAAHYLGIKLVLVSFDPVTFEADVDEMRAAITPNTILLVGSSPGYAHGVIDPISEIAALAKEHDLLCHVDCCVGGIHLSIARRMGDATIPDFDFSLPGVTSISVDMHKFGYAPKNVSTILYRSKELRRYQLFASRKTTSYAIINPTVLSAKSTGPLAGAWTILHYLGESGYQEMVRTVNEATRKLVNGINAIEGLRVLGNPAMCMFSFTSDELNIYEVGDAMHDRGWYVQPQFTTDHSPANLHITIDNASAEHVDAILEDLKGAVDDVRALENPIDAEVVRAQVHGLLESFGDDAADQLSALAGLEGTEVPEHTAMINTVMDALPNDLTESLLTDFMNDLYA